MERDRGFRLLPHTADEGLEAWGPDFGSACAQAALALYAVMGTPQTLAGTETWERSAAGADRADLVVRLLAALVADFEIEGRFATAASCVAPESGPGDHAATLRLTGGRVDRTRERGLVEVKAVTYHGLRIDETPGRTTLRVYLDL
jgi:SHS2 domain-containing protein